MPSLNKELRLGLRQLLRSPGFAAVAILTLALGIGANAAILSVVNAVLLKSLPFEDPSRLVIVSESFPQVGFGAGTFAAADYTAYQEQQKSCESVGAVENLEYELSGTARPQHVTAARVTSSIFQVLGVKPFLGRTFTAQEDRPGSNFVVLSYGLWSQQFSLDRDIIGKQVHLDRIPYTVMGVMPSGFKFPMPGPALNNKPADLWVPMAFSQFELQTWGGRYNFTVFGRLRRGASAASASAEMATLAPGIQGHYPPAFAQYTGGAKLAINLSPYNNEVVGNVRVLLVLLFTSVILVLVIACANLGALLLSRGIRRQREMAVRAALGAGHWALVRQLFAENLVLALLGGSLGWLLAFAGRSWFLSLLPASIPIPNDIEFGGSVIGFTLVLTLVACFLFGVAPTLLLKHKKLGSALYESGRHATAGAEGQRMQSVFVTAEFALAVVLLVGSGLLLRSFDRLAAVDPGFRASHVLVLSVPLPAQSYGNAAQIRSFYQQTLDHVGAISRIQSLGMASDLPLHTRDTGSFFIEGRKEGSNMTPPSIHYTWVLGDYLKSLSVPLVRGRWLAPDDRQGTMPVALVNATMARQFWPGGDALGKRIQWAAGGPWLTIVGIVEDIKDDGLRVAPGAHVYKPFLQEDDAVVSNPTGGGLRNLKLVVQTKDDPVAMAKQVENEIHLLDRDLAVAEVRTMEHDVTLSIARERFSAFLITVFAALAIFLAAIGVYGVSAFSVAQQTSSIGLRMALGAQRGDVLRMVLMKSTKLAVLGIVLGLVGAWQLTHYIRTLLYGVGSADPLSFVGAPLVLLLVALAGAGIPAWRASQVDPMVALRHE